MAKQKRTLYLNRWVWYSFLRTAFIPLILVELVFIFIYFGTFNWSKIEISKMLKNEVDEELTQMSFVKSSGIDQQLENISFITDMYARQTASALESEAELSEADARRLAYSDNGIYYTTSDTKKGGAAVFYSGIFKIGEQ